MEEKLDRKDTEHLSNPENYIEVIGELQQLSKASWERVCEYRRVLDALDYQKCLLKLEEIKNEQLR